MNDETDRLKRDLQIIENALGVNLWTTLDIRRGLRGVIVGAGAGLFLAIWCASGGSPTLGLLVFLSILAATIVAKGIGFNRQQASALRGSSPGRAVASNREIVFYNRFYSVGGILVGCFYIWGQRRGLEPLTLLAATIVLTGAWYVFYAISAPSRWISIGGAIPLTACGFILADARSFSQALSWLGLATLTGCLAEAVLLSIALRPPPASPNAPAATPPPTPSSGPIPTPTLCNAAH